VTGRDWPGVCRLVSVLVMPPTPYNAQSLACLLHLPAMRHFRIPSPEKRLDAEPPSVPRRRVPLKQSKRGAYSGPIRMRRRRARDVRAHARALSRHGTSRGAAQPARHARRAARAQELAGDEAAAPLLATPAGLTDLLLGLACGAAADSRGGDLALAQAAAMVLATLGPPGLPARLGTVRGPGSCGAREPFDKGGDRPRRRARLARASPRSPGPSTRWRESLAARRRAQGRAKAARPRRARTTPAARQRPPGRCCTGWLRTWRARAARCRCSPPPAVARGAAGVSDRRLYMSLTSMLLRFPHAEGQQAAVLVLCGASRGGKDSAEHAAGYLLSSRAPAASSESLDTALAMHIIAFAARQRQGRETVTMRAFMQALLLAFGGWPTTQGALAVAAAAPQLAAAAAAACARGGAGPGASGAADLRARAMAAACALAQACAACAAPPGGRTAAAPAPAPGAAAPPAVPAADGAGRCDPRAGQGGHPAAPAPAQPGAREGRGGPAGARCEGAAAAGELLGPHAWAPAAAGVRVGGEVHGRARMECGGAAAGGGVGAGGGRPGGPAVETAGWGGADGADASDAALLRRAAALLWAAAGTPAGGAVGGRADAHRTPRLTANVSQ
jgi:hypothetical protein